MDVPETMRWWDLWPSGDRGGPETIRGSKEKAELVAQDRADDYGIPIFVHRVTSKRVATMTPTDSEDGS